MLEMAEVIFSETPRRMQERVIWIDGESGVRRAEAIDGMVSVCQVNALRVIGPRVFWVDDDGSVGLAEHFCVVVDVRVRPTK